MNNLNKFASAIKEMLPGMVKPILMPYAITRLLLVIAGLASPLLLPFQYEPEPSIAARGWIFSPFRLIDMWARWDSGWYLAIVKEGYRMVQDVYTMSNLAFYPAYPFFIKLLTFIIPKSLMSDGVIIFIGIVLSNLFLILTMAVLYKLVRNLFQSECLAKNTIWLMLVFPTSFFLSSFYSESLFLLLSVSIFFLGYKGYWGKAGLLTAFLTATRPVGIMMIPVLALIYLKQKNYQLKYFDHSAISFLIMPAGMLLFFSYLYFLTGDWLASVKVQNAWGKQVADPIKSLISPSSYWPMITPFDQVAVVTVLASSVAVIKNKFSSISLPLGIYSILLIMPVLFTGNLDSASRFIIVIFPVFIYWAKLFEKSQKWRNIVLVLLMGLQLFYFARFTQFYWAG